MAKDMREIRAFIEEMLGRGYEKFVIFPFGDVGMQVKSALNYAYGIQEEFILDNYLWRYNKSVKPLAYMAEIEHKSHAVLLSSTNCEIYRELKENLLDYFDPEQIAELKSMKMKIAIEKLGGQREKANVIQRLESIVMVRFAEIMNLSEA